MNNYKFLLLNIISLFFWPIFNSEARSVAIFFALEKDWEVFSGLMDSPPQARSFQGQSIFTGRKGTTNIYATKMGSGPVNTASSAQLLLAKYPCDLALSVGPVGSLRPQIKQGDWLMVTQVVPWQKFFWRSEIGSDNAMDWIKFTDIPINDAEQCSVASGELFVCDSTLRREIAGRTRCDVVDMNLFGLLTVLSKFSVPSAHIRIVSDNADESASEDFQEFLSNYDGQGGKTLAEWVISLPEDKSAPDAHPNLRKLLGEPENN